MARGVAARVAVVGAGYAGMAAAVRLASRGIAVTVLESAAVPGGRARRIVSQGNALDNGQHILVGAYHALFSVMREVGVPSDALLRMPLEIRYAKGFAFRALWLPGSLGLAGGLLLARGVALRERFAAVRFLHRLASQRFQLPADITVGELLARHDQRGRLARFLWAPLCVSALNTPVDQASASAFLAVLRDTLAGESDAADLLLPRVDLSRLFPEPAAAYVTRKGGEVRLRAPVESLEALRGFDATVVAVGPHQLHRLLPGMAERFAFAYQPIYTCYLQYGDRVRLPFPMLGMADGLVQWVFDRGVLLGEKGRLACVISAQGSHQQMSHDALANACHRELAQVLPKLPAPSWHRVIAEKRATIACTPSLARPPLEAGGAILAGDYTDPEYPPTLEAAVRSGLRAAEHVLASVV